MYKMLTAPDEPPMTFSAILASATARRAGQPTGKLGFSLGPSWSKIAIKKNKKDSSNMQPQELKQMSSISTTKYYEQYF